MAQRTPPRWLALTLTLLTLAPAPVFGRAGYLDPTFGTGGIATTGTPAVVDAYLTLVLQPDGDVVTAGFANDLFAPPGPALTRRLSDGSLDPTFGTGGMVVTPPVADFDSARRVLLQPDGKMLLVGLTFRSVAPFVYGIVVARYDADGVLDPTFGTGGVVALEDSAAGSFIVADAVLAPDGDVVVTGSFWPVDPEATDDVLLARFTGAGALDATFGVGGVVTTDVGAGDDGAAGVVLEPDGRVVVAGNHTATDGSTADALLARYDAGGVLDASFGMSGLVIADLGSAQDHVWDLLRQPDGKLVVVGAAGPAGDLDVVLARYDAMGVPDAAFGVAGMATLALSDGDDVAPAGLLEADGKLVLVGSVGTAAAGVDLAVARCRRNGALDGSFGTGGVTTVAAGTGFGAWLDVARQPDAGLVTVGLVDRGDAFLDGLVARFGTGSCPPAPRPTCKRPTRAGKSVLQLRDRSPNGGDALKWRWSAGDATGLDDFGDPLGATAYSFCVYDESGPTPALVYEATAPAGGTCGAKPCWKLAGTKGFKRKDPDALSEGLVSHLLKAGEAGKAQAVVKGKGERVGPPGLPLALPLRAQLQAFDAGCFEARYSVAARNAPTFFKAISD
jgi:uncharacterized delta-60 repeat protein